MSTHIKIHNENSRVKIPALVHLTRLGYTYLSLKGRQDIHPQTNIFKDLLRPAIKRINCRDISEQDLDKLLEELTIKLSNKDLGKAFYSILLNGLDNIRLIDLQDPTKNTYHVVTELPYENGDDNFRPDITLLINGLPLAFIEVKKPNNHDGMIAEHDRMHVRFTNPAFLRFANITQLMVFSNNMEYDDSEIVPVEGAFYASTNYGKLFFSHFREEDSTINTTLAPILEECENEILLDNNLVPIKGTQEYGTNLSETTPTNRILTSLFSIQRFLLLLKYGFAYVERSDKNGIKTLEKHVMRYPQLFATLAIEKQLNQNVKHGIIWHTQGSGKTALAFYNVRYLKDYYQRQGKITKFFFIVDRIDLLNQAAEEFTARGLHVERVNSKEDFIKHIGKIGEKNNTGEDSITVVNIQKFSTESVCRQADYDVSIQRIYFLDEAHRSYNPKGSFLANLMNSDRDAVTIALTGTPLIGEGYNTKDVFGNYIHKYYYNRSIADGYTLKLIREGIRTEYRAKLQSVLEDLETQKGSLTKRDVFAHPKYVKALIDYIVADFKRSRLAMDSTIGAMIVCDSSEQARAIHETLKDVPELSHALILHDEGDKETRKKLQKDFKTGELDLLVVYNMLLTGFDAPRLKKQYLGRVVKDHNLLQTLTRVNRPYRNFHHGYVVDFADIRKEFDKTNQAYFQELQAELGDEFQRYQNIFMSSEEIEQTLQDIQNKLFYYSSDNLEMFSQQITAIDDKQELLDLQKALTTYQELQNVSKLFGYDELSKRFSLENLHAMLTEVTNRIAMVNQKEALQNCQDAKGLLNIAMAQIDFHFKKVSEKEMVIADKFQTTLETTRTTLGGTLDPKDPDFISLLEELKRIFHKKNIEELTAEEMNEYIQDLERIRKLAEQLRLQDQMLCAKYHGDVKYMRTHKRMKSSAYPFGTDLDIFTILNPIKTSIDQMILKNLRIIDNGDYFSKEINPIIITTLLNRQHQLPPKDEIIFINKCLVQEYMTERTQTA